MRPESILVLGGNFVCGEINKIAKKGSAEMLLFLQKTNKKKSRLHLVKVSLIPCCEKEKNQEGWFEISIVLKEKSVDIPPKTVGFINPKKPLTDKILTFVVAG